MEKRLGNIIDYITDDFVKISWMWAVSTIAVVFLFQGHFAWIDLLWILVAHYVIYLLGLEVGYHKLLTHKAFKTQGWIKNTLAVIGNVTCHPPVLQWVTIHRLHHATSDKDKDPHSPWHPKRGLLAYVFLTRWEPMVREHEFKDDRFLIWLTNNQGWCLWLTTAILLMFFDLQTVLVWFAIPSVISPYLLGIANYYTHQGKHNGYDYSRNWYWIEVLTPGMGFHGNHHDEPGAWTLAKKYWWIDLSSIVVKLIKR